MNVKLIFVAFAAVVVSGPVFAAPVISTTTTSAANSSSAAIGAVGAPVANARGGAARAAGGSSISSLHATQRAAGGAGGTGVGSVSVGGAKVTQNFASSKIPLQVPSVFPTAVPSPQIFSRLNAPTVVKGISITEWFFRSCDTTATREHPLKDEHFHHSEFLFGAADDISGYTYLTFSPTQAYYAERQYPHYKGKLPLFPKPVPVESVSVVTAARVDGTKEECLGLLTVTETAAAAKKDIPLSSVVSDARILPFRHMRGHHKIELVMLPSTVAAALGVRTAGSSFSVVPTFVKMATNVLSAGSAGASISGGEGATYASSEIGATFLVLAPSEYGYGKIFNIK